MSAENPLINAHRVKLDKKRRTELRRCQTDLWYLLTEYLGYGWNPEAGGGAFPGKGLTEALHRPICQWIDRNWERPFGGIWMGRWHHKTTIVVGEIIKAILNDPYGYFLYFHAVDDEAQKVVQEVGNHILRNPKLRALDPIGESVDKDGNTIIYRCFPLTTARRFLSTDRFTLRRPAHKFSRFPTLLGKGVGSEMTGAHGKRAWVDDIIGRNTVEDNQLPKVASWFRSTLLPVVDEMWVRAKGTPWSDWGLYSEWWGDRDWDTIIIPGSTEQAYRDEVLDLGAAQDMTRRKIHLEPDYTLEHPVYGQPKDREKMSGILKLLQRQMRSEFAYQIMVDTTKTGDKPWDRAKCENICGLKPKDGNPGADGDGTVFVLSDPAPKTVGGADQFKEKGRGDGTKDFWAFAVVKVRVRGQRREVILLDGSHSREWTTPEGMDEACRLMTKWRTNKCIHESYGGLSQNYDIEMHKATLRNGVSWMRYGRDNRPIAFANSLAKNAKNLRFENLCAAAKNGEFWIWDGCPEVWLNGTDETVHEGFLPQAREWRPLPNGRNSLRYDDDADVVARCTDPVIDEYAPSPFAQESAFNPFMRKDAELPSRARYCGGV